MLVAGEAGVGKTTLVRHFCERSESRVLWGHCDALFTPSPLGPLNEMGIEAADVHHVASALLEDLRRPAIVVFEDVHWADEATLDVLRLLGRRIANVPALVVATYRDDELERTHPLRLTLGELSRQATTVRLRVAPLSAEAVAELAAPYGVDAAELHRRTHGNPFFVTEALAAGGIELPATIRDAVLARVIALSADARRVPDAAAIVPGPVDIPLLEALAGDAVERLEECLACGVLGPSGGGVAFRHDLARLAVEEALAPNERVALHRRALAALAGRADPARVAYHAEGAADAEAVLRSAPLAAARAATAGAHREAAAQYGRVLRFADALDATARAELHEHRAHECVAADQPRDAIDDLERALALRGELGDRRAEGRLLRTLSSTLWCPGELEWAERAGLDAIAVAGTARPGSTSSPWPTPTWPRWP